MGGKTQRRAGGVKPTSSGRIREIHGTGNIITFSALASNSNNKPDRMPDKFIKPKPVETKPVEEASPIKTDSQKPQSPPPSNDKATYKLVLKRVGNRDLFVRVRVPEDISPEQASDNLKIVDTRHSGVFHPPAIDETIEAASEKNDANQDDLKSQINAQQSEQEEKPKEEEEYDFDTILDQLDCLKSSLNKDCDLFVDAGSIALEVELLRILDILVRKFYKDLSLEEWDLVVNSTSKWVKSICSTNLQHIFKDIASINFSVNVFNFINEVIELAKGWANDSEISGEEYPMLKSLLDDWNNFHSSTIFQDLIVLYFRITSDGNLNQDQLRLLLALSNIIIDVDPKMLIFNGDIANYSTVNLDIEQVAIELPKNCKYCEVNEVKFKGFSAICNLLKSNYRVISILAHSMLSKNMFVLCEDVQASSISNDDLDKIDENLSLVPPKKLMSILTSRDSMMSALLSDYQVGDISVTIDPNSDSYTCTLTYLFVWDLVIQFIVELDKEIAHHMIHCLKKLGLIQRLLDNVFMLLPPLGERDSVNFKVENRTRRNKYNQPNCLSDFLKGPLRTALDRPSNEIELTALHLYFSVASHMPVTVRKWYNNNSNKRLCNLVNEYTLKHISKVICSLEMETVQEKCQERANTDKMNNLVIKARPNASEVYAIYTRDEFCMELTIKLPNNYPLGPVQIDGGKRIGVTDLKWRSWLLQLTTFLSHQNGPILDGIDLWRRNIDKRFEGVEKCMICFSILHSNYQLPKKKCQTCTKMFHNLCLYKWFESSGNSTCPLCRNIW